MSSPRSTRSANRELPAQIARWLDALDETGRWALLKLVTGALRVGVSARLAKTAAAALGDKDVTEIELMWSGLEPPYDELFAWLEGRGDKPSHAGSRALPPGDAGARDRGHRFRRSSIRRTFSPNGNGTASACRPQPGVNEHGERIVRMYSRTGEDISKSFPDLTGLAELQRLARRRIADPARGPRAELQRAAATAEPQSRDAETARGISGASARL